MSLLEIKLPTSNFDTCFFGFNTYLDGKDHVVPNDTSIINRIFRHINLLNLFVTGRKNLILICMNYNYLIVS